MDASAPRPPFTSASPALHFEVLARCSTTRARVSRMTLPHGPVDTPTFMPVATQATMKSVTSAQLESIDPPINLHLANTFHMSQRPTAELLDIVGGVHRYAGFRRNLLTDSGGFQMVSLVKLSRVEEEGVLFANPYDPSKSSLLTPERSMQIQHSIGADIMMQLDDVVSSLTTGARMEEAMWRSIRWLDRCLAEHARSGKATTQNLFAIVQGGLDPILRDQCLVAMTSPERAIQIPGYAIGGLSGGEEKTVFWQIVKQCAAKLPEDKPRYCMGIGYGEDLLVCAALGVDLADCVYPTRTARFGVALTFNGPLNLRSKIYSEDFSVIDPECSCATCDKGEGMSRAALAALVVGKEAASASAVTVHNLTYQSALMHRAREAIMEDRFPQYLIDFFAGFFKSKDKYPEWAVAALQSVGVDLMTGVPTPKA
ncbi:queuine tRNA-ribosyltransferase [Leucosporidium creatinivorum]|uniref:Queuine tRNA-ribosyltransferase catalytic subunit 1 n=1 Tax=Leucosporidium creatinivorum TaxID=106004 RepID=A0A1Y2FZM5_9BASI|nr:queuine tRNA-ribosyltransferase [Leucosporidium creatinivorum]